MISVGNFYSINSVQIISLRPVKKSWKSVQEKDSTVLLIRELSSDTTRISEIKERKGLHRESALEVEATRTFF